MTREPKDLRDKAARALRHSRKVRKHADVFRTVADIYKQLAAKEDSKRGELPRSRSRRRQPTR